MASSVVKNIALKSVRTYAAQAAASQQVNYSLPYHQAQVSKLPSGAVVSSLENNSPVATVSILFKAGSRYESGSNLGVSHIVRAAAGLTTESHTAFKITRLVQQLGGTIVAENGREHVSYTIHINRDHLGTCLDLIGSVAAQPMYKDWEIREQLKLVDVELQGRLPVSVSIDQLHNAAYRQGLGNSIFTSTFNLKNAACPDTLKQFHSSTHTADRMAVAGMGVDHDSLLKFAKSVNVGATGSAADGGSAYKGGNARIDIGGDVSSVAIAGQGAKIGHQDSASLAIAQYLLGVGPTIKYSSPASGKLMGIVAQAGGVGSASAINCNYSDGGLFGFHLEESADKVGIVSKAITKALRSMKFSDAEVKLAKVRAKSAVSYGLESQAVATEDMGLQGLFSGSYLGQAEIVAALDKVDASSVNQAMSKVFSGKLSIGGVGGLRELPYNDEI